MEKKQIEDFLSQQNLKRTLDRKGVYFEQKITPDLINFISRAIMEFTKNDESIYFSDEDIRNSPFFIQMIKEFFSKPSQSKKTENEYNKVSSYQIGLLAFSGVLEDLGGRPKTFKIANKEMLSFIAQHEMNSLSFLELYVMKLLKDNDLLEGFNMYQIKPTQENYVRLKRIFWEWAKVNTAVRGNKSTHSNRVFNKIFNLFAHFNHLPGESHARIKPGICPYSFLIYNSENWRDKYKPKNIPRKEYEIELEKEGVEIGDSVVKAKSKIKRKYSNSEIVDQEEYVAEKNPSMQIHHIFPAAHYPAFSAYLENLISLTVGQHMSHAHQGNTHWIDPHFQIVCLISKLKNIKESLFKKEDFYDSNKFIEIINEGLGLRIKKNENLDGIKRELINLKNKL
jgi:hypothetical protein